MRHAEPCNLFINRSRKWKLNLLNRNDLGSLTLRANEITGIPLIEEIEKEKMENILFS